MQGQAFAKQGSTGGAFAAGFFSAAILAAVAFWIYAERPAAEAALPPPTETEVEALLGAPALPSDLEEQVATAEAEQVDEDTAERSTDDAEVAALRVELAKTRRESERYERGLEQAVAKLNQMQRDLNVARRGAATTQRSRPSPSRARPSAPRSATVTTGVFRTLVNGDQATAMGWVKNYEDESTSGTLYIELFESGTRRLIDSTRESMTLAPGEDSRWEYQFQIPLGLSVTVNSTWESN